MPGGPSQGMLLARLALQDPDTMAEMAASAGLPPPSLNFMGTEADLNALLSPQPQSPLAGIKPPPAPPTPPMPATPPPPSPQAIRPSTSLVELLLAQAQQQEEGGIPAISSSLINALRGIA